MEKWLRRLAAIGASAGSIFVLVFSADNSYGNLILVWLLIVVPTCAPYAILKIMK